MFSWINQSPKRKASNELERVDHFILGSALTALPGNNQEEILFACGCFWGAEKGFWKLPGVTNTAVGYAGGHLENPTYQEICSGRTGHAEVVKVIWNKSLIDLSDLLKLFWECHDPTQGNRQGNDTGSQYRSAIYTTSKQQLDLVMSSKDSYQQSLIAKGYKSITTEIKENQIFFFAERYHQQYLAKPGSRPYCSAMPTNVPLEDFAGSNYKLSPEIWLNYNWQENHCVLRSDNKPIEIINEDL